MTQSKAKYTTFDIIKTQNISREKLQDWMNRSYVTPTVMAEGQGTKALFTVENIYGLELFRCLIGSGFSRSVASDYVKRFVEKVSKYPDKYPTEARWLVIRIYEKGESDAEIVVSTEGMNGHDLTLRYETGITEWKGRPVVQIDKDKGRWQQIIVIDFQLIKENVDKGLAAL